MDDKILNKAIQAEEKPIGDSFKEVNKALDVSIDGLHPRLQTLKAHALQLSVNYKPINDLVDNLNKHKPFVSQTTGEDVRKLLSVISKGMGEAIQPIKKFKFPS